MPTNVRQRRSRAQGAGTTATGDTLDLRDGAAARADGAGSSGAGSSGAGADGAGSVDSTPDVPVVVDGRTARAERTRAAIVDALLSLLEEGDLLPTAHRIAERAGISLRLIYHHFGDLESLFQAVSARQFERMQDLLVPIDESNALDRRIDDLVAKRLSLHERMAPIRRASLLQEPFSPHIISTREQATAYGRCEIESLFAAELASVDPPEHEVAVSAIAAALTWGAWNDLDLAERDHDEIAAATTLLIRGVMYQLA